MPRPARLSRDTLLDAADAIVRQTGPSGLTLDAVARQAGVSKGGLLHLFPSKNALITGMLERLIARTQSEIDALAAEPLPGSGSALHDYIWGTFATANIDQATGMSIMAAVPEHPALLDPIRDFYREHVARIAAEARGDADALILWLAAEGLLLLDLLGISPLTDDQSHDVAERLLERAKDTR